MIGIFIILCISVVWLGNGAKEYKINLINPDEIRNLSLQLLNESLYLDVLTLFEEVRHSGFIPLDNHLPSLYGIEGIAYHGIHKHHNAESCFQYAVAYNPQDTRSWINLGEVQVLQSKFYEASSSFIEAWTRGNPLALSRVVQSLSFCNGWGRDYEVYVALLEKQSNSCNNRATCLLDSLIGLEYTDISPQVKKYLLSLSTSSKHSSHTIQPYSQQHHRSFKSKLKVGFISSDFDTHPVSSLIRGVIQYLDKDRVGVYCFALTSSSNWWMHNISSYADEFIILDSLNTIDAATVINSFNIDILIDLNSHTKNSSLPILSHHPAPIQISFLGSPTTTAASFIDYYIGDYVALPPEHADHFSEKLVLLHPSYLPNDHAQIHGHVINQPPAKRSYIKDEAGTIMARFIFATLSNSHMIDPEIFHVWMNIMRRHGGSMLSFMNHTSANCPSSCLKKVASMSGIDPDRLPLAPITSWQTIDHLYRKTSVDMFLDTAVKNGHTTGLDGIWAGVPTMTLGSGSSMPTRAGESIASALGNEVGVAYSLKEYEDMIYRYAQTYDISSSSYHSRMVRVCQEALKDFDDMLLEECLELSTKYRDNLMSGEEKLSIWRQYMQSSRLTSLLFDTKSWTQDITHLLQALVDLSSISRSQTPKYHIFATSRTKSTDHNHKIQTYHAIDSMTLPSNITMPAARHRYGRDILFEIKRKSYASQNEKPSTDMLKRVNSESRPTQLLNPDTGFPNDIFQGMVLLNIGGSDKLSGWLNVNAQLEPYGIKGNVDIIRRMDNLTGFPNSSVHAIYCSHSLEHNGIGNSSLQQTLLEWRRVLVPNGLLMISVPNLRAIFTMYLNDKLDYKHKFMAMMMIYGGQSDMYDYHKIGFDEVILTSFLKQHGFCQIERVGSFNLFNDTSNMIYEGYRISLNMAAKRCPVKGERVTEDMYEVSHNADKFDRSLEY